ncbi:hypothetical protein TorRG33x02_247690 [Trema orientale]|uniref:Uncharacterized protein n=1 Tax=Trema orientale TaxID=63057 RepID=A0A2P5DLL9_TREOI|nr:hypothetical protein TorRG33x02_247690 [Trema orientale]
MLCDLVRILSSSMLATTTNCCMPWVVFIQIPDGCNPIRPHPI